MANEQSTPTKKESQVETVTMADGRKVDFAGKRKMLKESLIDANGAILVRCDFRNGKTINYTLPQTLIAKFAAHGAEQKLGDETAGLDDVDDAYLAVEQLAARLTGPDGWSMQRESSGLAGTSVLARALAEHTGKSMDEIKEFLGKKSQAEKVALRNNAKIKPIVERIEAEKAAKGTKVDTEALLGELAS